MKDNDVGWLFLFIFNDLQFFFAKIRKFFLQHMNDLYVHVYYIVHVYNFDRNLFRFHH